MQRAANTRILHSGSRAPGRRAGAVAEGQHQRQLQAGPAVLGGLGGSLHRTGTVSLSLRGTLARPGKEPERDCATPRLWTLPGGGLGLQGKREVSRAVPAPASPHTHTCSATPLATRSPPTSSTPSRHPLDLLLHGGRGAVPLLQPLVLLVAAVVLLDQHGGTAALPELLLLVVAAELALDQDGRLRHLLVESVLCQGGGEEGLGRARWMRGLLPTCPSRSAHSPPFKGTSLKLGGEHPTVPKGDLGSPEPSN